MSPASRISTAILAGLGPSNAIPVYNNGQSLNWGSCPDNLGYTPRIECANFQVPMDWDDTSKGEVKLGIVRLPALEPENRIGNLFYNPGGPGIKPSQDLAATDPVHPPPAGVGVGTLWDMEIAKRFDIIGVDLRGTGLSSPISCSADLFLAPLEMYPTTNKSFNDLVENHKAFRESCIEMSGSPLIEYMDTISIAKDHEAVRQALGNEKMTWFGQSYGTMLGSQIAELFPNNIRAMLFDGPASVGTSPISIWMEGASSAEATMKYFFDWCAKQNETVCPAAYQNQSMEVAWLKALERADAQGIPATVCALNGTCVHTSANAFSLVNSALSNGLYGPSEFPGLSTALYEAVFENNATLALRGTSVKDMNKYNASSSYALKAITCQDWAHPDVSPADIEYKKLLAWSEAPLLRGISPEFDFQWQCIGWPAPKRNPPHKIDIPRNSSMPTTFLIATEYDPATPLAMAVNLREQIGKDRAVLAVRKNAAGHAAYFQPDAQGGKALAAMNEYLLTGKAPAQGTIYDD